MAFGYTTLSIPIREGDTKFPYAMKLVPPKDLERIDHWHLVLFTYITDTWHENIGTLHFSQTNTWHALIILKCMAHKHRIFCLHEFSVTW
jgi:hypothetical protein